ncbi:astacin-like [Oratosquilla oratoria]|uniref:astacin-like n=1 Tax=Oratosquilla oratoria TaxID=337810 RepID=UPI003F762480
MQAIICQSSSCATVPEHTMPGSWWLLIAAAAVSLLHLSDAELIVVKGTAYDLDPRHYAVLDSLIDAERFSDMTSYLAKHGRVVDDDLQSIEEDYYDEDDAFVNEIETRETRALPKPWPNAVIPYKLLNVTKATRSAVASAMRDISAATCVVFKERTAERKYLIIKDTSNGCWTSYLGFPGRKPKVVINLGKGCRHHGQATHEIGHALGFIHEHTRLDRDEFVNIIWNHITRKGPFKKNHKYVTPELPYDYKSVMHYGRRAFSQGKTESIVPKVNVVGRLGASALSRLDILRINTFYKCPI